MLKFIFAASLLVVSGCQQSRVVLQELDLLGFRLFGKALLSDTSYVRIKEVHLNNRVLLGKPVIVAGALQKVGDQRTYLVMADSSAKLVVDLTSLSVAERAELEGERENGKKHDEGERENGKKHGEQRETRLKVLGVVGLNNKGHPHLLAKAIKPLRDTAI